MTEPAGTGGVIDTDTALRHEAETLSHRFPEVTPDELDARLHEAYDELKEHARIQSHLIALSSAHVTGELLRDAHHHN